MFNATWSVEITTVTITPEPEVAEMESNYRVVWNEDELYTIFEVYYDDEGNIEDWDDTVVSAVGADFEDLAAEVEKMAAALELPVLYINEDGELVELEEEAEDESDDSKEESEEEEEEE